MLLRPLDQVRHLRFGLRSPSPESIVGELTLTLSTAAAADDWHQTLDSAVAHAETELHANGFALGHDVHADRDELTATFTLTGLASGIDRLLADRLLASGEVP